MLVTSGLSSNDIGTQAFIWLEKDLDCRSVICVVLQDPIKKPDMFLLLKYRTGQVFGSLL